MKKGNYRKVVVIFEPEIPKTKFQKEKRIVINGLKKLNKKELRWLGRFIKADGELNFGLLPYLIENAIKEINSKPKHKNSR